ncbi:Protein of unknown function [Pyronema omphalodes CBS 100304]|uniref:Uncharacterized protein n=1 Tax=Pyronema omphalodes (strain CBS 100304) TaxID=1076935 RepID=U4L826_PYROM|nr:Protein of unknown function [Pyronema omphalodes CBS 100304]
MAADLLFPVSSSTHLDLEPILPLPMASISPVAPGSPSQSPPQSPQYSTSQQSPPPSHIRFTSKRRTNRFSSQSISLDPVQRQKISVSAEMDAFNISPLSKLQNELKRRRLELEFAEGWVREKSEGFLEEEDERMIIRQVMGEKVRVEYI